MNILGEITAILVVLFVASSIGVLIVWAGGVL